MALFPVSSCYRTSCTLKTGERPVVMVAHTFNPSARKRVDLCEFNGNLNYVAKSRPARAK